MTVLTQYGYLQQKPARHIWTPQLVAPRWLALARDLVCVIPFWSGSGEPMAWIDQTGWSQSVESNTPAWDASTEGIGYDATTGNADWNTSLLPSDFPIKSSTQTPITVYLRMAFRATPGFNRVFGFGDVGEFIRFDDSFTTRLGTVNTSIAKPAAGWALNQVYGFGVTHDLANERLYIDGVLGATSGASTTKTSIGYPLAISWAAAYAAGIIHVIYVWSRALTSAEMALVHQYPYALLTRPRYIPLVGGSPWYQYLQQAG